MKPIYFLFLIIAAIVAYVWYENSIPGNSGPGGSSEILATINNAASLVPVTTEDCTGVIGSNSTFENCA